MSDVYRAPGYECPRCPGAALRVYGERLVCDECHGLLMSPGDFRRACEDDAGQPLEPVFHAHPVDGEEASLACPRCARVLVASRVELAGTTYKTAMWRCAGDGVWMDVDALVGLLALVARKHGRAGQRGVSDGSRASPRIGPGGSALQFTPASAALRISSWWDHPHPRPPRPPAVDPYAGRSLRCPACARGALVFAGDRWGCATCRGVFVPHATLAELVSEMTAQPWELAEPTGPAGERACPACASRMRVETLEGVAVERCAEHGLWFDDARLAAVLEHAGEPAKGLGAWLRRLFA